MMAAAKSMPKLQEQRPARVGPFEIVGVLGEGGMGVVYSARLPGSSHRVAVKTVPVVQESLLSSMRREIHALGRLVHPGVVRVLMSGIDEGRPWYAMELLEGITLAALRDEIWTLDGTVRLHLPSPMEGDNALTVAMGRAAASDESASPALPEPPALAAASWRAS